MKHPSRCNKRACQARRTLSMHVNQYIRKPKCHMHGCSGMMYVVKRGKQDRSVGEEVCKNDCRPWPHKTSDKQCRFYLDYLKARNNAPRSKHSPIPANEWTPF